MISIGKHLFCDGWSFCLKDIGNELSDILHEGNWHRVEIPHDWLIGDTKNLYKTGEGWYKKSFTLDKADTKNKLFITFDGVYMNTTVFLNGEAVGEWKYGYSSFTFDISRLVREGENELYVRVRFEAPNSRWYSGAGIYRNVWLRAARQSYVETDGIYISADISGKLEISSERIGDGELRHTVISPNGTEIASATGDNITLKIENPILWSPDSPCLYTLKTELFANNALVETINNRFGFRSVELSPSEGFKLNGKTVKLRGVCLHHDLGALGTAVNRKALLRQMKILKSYGVNAVRISHNMPAPELVEICDVIGLMMDDEAFDMWELPKNTFDYARFFDEWYEKDVAAWVRRDRNHPCVIMWSVGNEIYDTHKSERGREVAEMLCEAVYKSDYRHNARPTLASNYMSWENAQKVNDYIKTSGYNYTENLYDDHHAAHPDWFIYGSETASTVRSRGVYHFPAETPLLTHEDMQCSDLENSVVGWGRAQESALIMDRDRSYCGGQFVWTGFDYIGEPTPYSSKNSFFGIVDTAGLPKNAYYLYKSVWTDPKMAPFVHIAPYWCWNEGQLIDVLVYSNYADTELFLNGKSLGKAHVDLLHGNTLHGLWHVPYEKGELRAVAYDENGNIAAEDYTRTFGDATKLELSSEENAIKANGVDLLFVEISALDKDGNPVHNANNRVKITVSGEGSLVGLDNGDSTDYDSYKGNNRRLFSGKLVAIIKPTFSAGKIKLTASSVGLESAEIVIDTLPAKKTEGISELFPSYPVMEQPDNDEVPIRSIELVSDRTALDAEHKTAHIAAKILPENASYKDLDWKCVRESGVETPIASIENGTLTAIGDGSLRLRVSSKNGGTHTHVFSELEFSIEGLGAAVSDPYGFISAALYSFSNTKPNIIERGAIGGIKGKTVIGFDSYDFGKHGTDRLRLHIGNSLCMPLPVELWLGDEKNGRLLTTLQFAHNGRWDGFDPEDFVLPEKISGINSFSFVVDKHCIFGGFEFIKKNRAAQTTNAIDNDGIYGDNYSVLSDAVEKIGNNVFISFTDMDFGKGVDKITICGRTPNSSNTVQIRYDIDGTQKTQLVEFPNSEEYIEKTFSLETISGTKDISFVFLPGSSFDFRSFRFE